MRYFIALEIPEKSKDQIEMVQKKLKEIIPGVRLTDPDKLHLTIAFIGEKPEELKDDLIKAMQDATENIRPFIVTPAYIDGFPQMHHPSILWVGVKGDIDKLMVIRERVKDRLVKLGLEVDDRRYIPHVAIAKTNDNNLAISEEQEWQLQNVMMSEFAPIYIDSIKLFESVPEEGLHRHNTLAQVELK